jgi:CelD/BcsL family acetyltransferase involved in cellulose biosynthesis
MHLELLDIAADFTRIEAVWTQFAREVECSYFQSWGWMENWLQSLPPRARVQLAVIREGAEPVSAFFLGHGTVVNRHIFRSQAYLLNQTGRWEYDRLYIEHNRILCADGWRGSLQQMLALLPGRWEEIYLSALSAECFPATALESVTAPYELSLVKEMPCPYVNLDSVRQRAGDYLALLSSSVRSQVKRAYKLYGERGPITREVARDVPSALAIYDELIELHQASWAERGQKGAFATAYFRDFHRRLIERRHAAGEIQLVRVRAGEKTIGCLYNFVYQGVVSFYQSGLASESDNRLKPGYVCHVEAVKENAVAGCREYDFLAGVEDYKARLSTHQRSLIWARVQKPRLKFRVERVARRLALAGEAKYRAWKSRKGRERSPGAAAAQA